MDRLKIAWLGLRRHSAMYLDAAGFPRRFIKWWCPEIAEWGTMLDMLDILSRGMIGPREDDGPDR